MLRLIVQFLVNCFGLWLSSLVLDGVDFLSNESLLAAGLLLGIANAVVRPILTIVTFPLTIVTLGLFLLVVNAAVIGLVASLLGGFIVDGLWPGIGAAVVTGTVSLIAGWLMSGDPARRSAG
jgi:putative membrane protein